MHSSGSRHQQPYGPFYLICILLIAVVHLMRLLRVVHRLIPELKQKLRNKSAVGERLDAHVVLIKSVQ
jgi:hypothetical protein